MSKIVTKEMLFDTQAKEILDRLRLRMTWQSDLDNFAFNNLVLLGIIVYELIGEHYGGTLDDALTQLEDNDE